MRLGRNSSDHFGVGAEDNSSACWSEVAADGLGKSLEL